MSKRSSRISTGMILAALLCPPAPTAAFNWTGDGDGFSFNDPDNWDPPEGAPPGPGDAAILSSPSASILFSGPVTTSTTTVTGLFDFLLGTNIYTSQLFVNDRARAVIDGGAATIDSLVIGDANVGGNALFSLLNNATLNFVLPITVGTNGGRGEFTVSGGTTFTALMSELVLAPAAGDRSVDQLIN